MSEWISVKERLPEKNDEYIAFCIHSNDSMVTSLFFEDGVWLYDWDDGLIANWNQFVTHWMPLPEPPND